MSHPDPLRDLIHDRRADFDAEPPPARVWDALEAELSHDRPGATVAPRTSARVVALYPYWRKAAVACMLLTIGVLSGLLLADRLDGDEAVAARPTPVRELEASYRQLLAERVAEVEALGPDSALRVALVGLSRPDSQLASELEAFPPADEHLVLEAMAQEYQAKLDALERVLARVRAAEARAGRPQRADRRRLNEAPAAERL